MNERDIFLAAVEIADPAERSAYVALACAENRELLTRVVELLKTHDEASQFLEQPAVAADSAVDHTIQTCPTDFDDGRASGEAEVRKYLEPAIRSGWLGRLAHYEIEEILGRGAFGIVAKAFDEKLQRVVAIKVLSPELALTSPPRKRFLREARAAAAVMHENIVAIHAVEEEPLPYLVMEYIPGQTLQEQMDGHGPLEVPEILRIGQQVAAGLAAAHAALLIHRDIKPSNILLSDSPDSRVKISDFGLARAVDDATLTSSGLIAGTPMYMAPEQARGETLDHRADLFSLGSVLYQMAGGRPPFRAANTLAVLKRVCEDTPRPLGDVLPGTPGWLESIIFKLLEKEPDDRFQAAREVADLLAQCQRELEERGKVTCVEGRATPRTMVESEPVPASRTVVLVKGKSKNQASRNRAFSATMIALGLIGTTIFASALIALFNTAQTEVADGAQAAATNDEHAATGKLAVGPSQNGTTDTPNELGPEPGPDQPPLAIDPASAIEGSLTINTSGGVASLAVSPDGKVLAGSLLGKPASIQFWNAKTGAPIQRFVPDAEDDSTPAQLSYSPQGEFLIYSASTGVFLLDLDKLQARKLQQFPTSPRIAVFPTSQLALALFHEQEAHRTELGKIPQRLRVWNWRTNEVLHDEQMAVQQQAPLAHPSVSPDERYLTFAWGHYYVRHDIQLSHDRFGLGSRVTFEKLVRIRGPLVFSPDSKWAAASTKSREYMGAFFEVESGKILHLLDPESAQATNRGHEFGCNFAFTGDGRRIVSTDHNGRVAVWEFPSGELVRELEEFHVEANHDPPELAVTKDGRVIVAGDYADSRVRILSLDPSERVKSQEKE